MLNIFPIQFLSPVAYALLRFCVGYIFIRLGFSHIRNRQSLKEVFSFPIFRHGLFFVWYMGILELVIGTLFILGLYTQIAALVGLVISLKIIILHTRIAHPSIPSRMFYTLLFVSSLSLFITGAGIFAFDLPL